MAQDSLITSENPFTARERRLIAAIAEMNIGSSKQHDMPPVSDSQILAGLFARAADSLAQVRQGLGSLSSILESEGSDAESPDLAKLTSLMSTHGELRNFDRTMMMMVAQAYYQDPRVLRSLGLVDRAPFPEGHEVEEGDWSLLEPVQAAGRKYREVP